MNSPGLKPGEQKAGIMPYRQIFYQIVFSTKYREPTIPEAFEKDLYQYIYGIMQNMRCKLYRINGMSDHIHIFSDLQPTVCLSDLVKNIKVASSGWMKEQGTFPDFTHWQNEYGAFTYNLKEKDTIIEYIKNQKEHHKRESSRDEYKRLLIENGIPFDEKYLI